MHDEILSLRSQIAELDNKIRALDVLQNSLKVDGPILK